MVAGKDSREKRFVVRKMKVGATGFELVAHPREKLSGTTTVLQAKIVLFILILLFFIS